MIDQILHLAVANPSLYQALVELQKAHRMSKMEPGWDREVEKLKRVVSFTLEYCQSKKTPHPTPFLSFVVIFRLFT